MMKLMLTLMLLLISGQLYGQCSGIQKRINTPKQKTIFYSADYNELVYRPVNFMRTDRPQRTVIDLILRVEGDSADTQKGLWLTFSDGSILAWPDRFVGFRTENGLSLWWADAPLTEEQLAQLSTKLISDIKVYHYEQSLTKEQAEQARAALNCIRSAK